MTKSQAAQALFKAQATVEKAEEQLDLAIDLTPSQDIPGEAHSLMLANLDKLKEITEGLCYVQNQLSK